MFNIAVVTWKNVYQGSWWSFIQCKSRIILVKKNWSESSAYTTLSSETVSFLLPQEVMKLQMPPKVVCDLGPNWMPLPSKQEFWQQYTYYGTADVDPEARRALHFLAIATDRFACMVVTKKRPSSPGKSEWWWIVEHCWRVVWVAPNWDLTSCNSLWC